MKITDIVATPVAVPLEKAETTSRMRKGPNAVIAVIVEVHTDEGIIGIGETPAVLGVDLSTAIVNSTKSLLLGRDPERHQCAHEAPLCCLQCKPSTSSCGKLGLFGD